MKNTLVGFIGLLMLILAAFTFAAADSPAEGRAGRAELRYMQGMIDHHQMALDMAADCLEKAQTESVLMVCQAVIDAQTPEIEQLRMWLLEWYNVDYQAVSMFAMGDAMGTDTGGHAGHGSMDMPHTDPPMMMGMMAGLNRVEGVDYEIAWLESMIDHHDDAIHMSERLLARVSMEAGHDALLVLAETIIRDQSAEIEAMESLIITLSDA